LLLLRCCCCCYVTLDVVDYVDFTVVVPALHVVVVVCFVIVVVVDLPRCVIYDGWLLNFVVVTFTDCCYGYVTIWFVVAFDCCLRCWTRLLIVWLHVVVIVVVIVVVVDLPLLDLRCCWLLIVVYVTFIVPGCCWLPLLTPHYVVVTFIRCCCWLPVTLELLLHTTLFPIDLIVVVVVVTFDLLDPTFVWFTLLVVVVGRCLRLLFTIVTLAPLLLPGGLRCCCWLRWLQTRCCFVVVVLQLFWRLHITTIAYPCCCWLPVVGCWFPLDLVICWCCWYVGYGLPHCGCYTYVVVDLIYLTLLFVLRWTCCWIVTLERFWLPPLGCTPLPCCCFVITFCCLIERRCPFVYVWRLIVDCPFPCWPIVGDLLRLLLPRCWVGTLLVLWITHLFTNLIGALLVDLLSSCYVVVITLIVDLFDLVTRLICCYLVTFAHYPICCSTVVDSVGYYLVTPFTDCSLLVTFCRLPLAQFGRWLLRYPLRLYVTIGGCCYVARCYVVFAVVIAVVILRNVVRWFTLIVPFTFVTPVTLFDCTTYLVERYVDVVVDLVVVDCWFPLPIWWLITIPLLLRFGCVGYVDLIYVCCIDLCGCCVPSYVGTLPYVDCRVVTLRAFCWRCCCWLLIDLIVDLPGLLQRATWTPVLLWPS